MGLLTFSDIDCFVIFYPLYLSVHGTLIQHISMLNNSPCRKPVSDHASAGVRFQAPRLRNVNFAAFSLQTAITKEDPMKNFLRLDGLSILSVQYMYIYYKDYLADSLLAQNHVSVRFENEFSRDDSSYRIILCKVKKKDTAGFEKSMELLCNKMLLFGHNDYMEFCNNIMETLGQNRGAA